ncbi:CDP-glucose 4,6-dehydratase [Mesorhizobium sp. YR577]|uniref:CDP-glucose 4,6-dehydratase n=1 Tax=Mesorhizobium sp. YR577 TaxID=1884373 RepID=UPI0008EE7D0B|nr:CDP-glucose 4,6-dehydratase [Mesorhizobium sp. YR577]SFU15418.1 CDP-glucose 4,6-dehydratase [Mesorhizobium sp. YR577]
MLITGHTGFCGGWLALWLKELDCEVAGLALLPETEPSLFAAADMAATIPTDIVDIRDRAGVARTVARIRPSVVFHLAAQPLVRRSYREPVETFDTNVQGTVHVLDAARAADVKALVAVTTDKVYRNLEAGRAFLENDELGGHDPYSASKAAAEMVIQSYQKSFGDEISIVAARGGNIIGGGDWSEDRLIPDAVRAVIESRQLELRNPNSTRPWQHVLALCHGYVQLAAALVNSPSDVRPAYNFGPDLADNLSVGEVVVLFRNAWRDVGTTFEPSAIHEAGLLAVNSQLARQELGWKPALTTAEAVAWTAEWYESFHDRGASAAAITREQILRYRDRCGITGVC